MGRVYEAFAEKIETPPAEGEASREKSEIFSQYSASQGEYQGRFHLYQADTFQDQYSNSFPRVCEVTSVDDLIAAARYDHIAGCCERGHRGAADFIQADCVISDVDNGKHDKGAVELPETEWKTPADVKARFPGVSFYVVYSRHDGIQRPGKEGEPNDSPRPRFKAYFPLAAPVTTKSGYDELQEKLSSCFPGFDSGAADCVHLMYGVKNPRVEYYGGDIHIDDYLREVETAKRNVSHFEGGSGELVCDALKHIDPSELSYDEWIHVGMALHAEGIPFDTFDEWSSQDPRPKMYSRQNCETHWRSFTSVSGGYTGGTIVKMAKDRGWQPASQRYEGDGCLDWDSVIGDPGDKEIEVTMPEVKVFPKATEWDPISEALKGKKWSDWNLRPADFTDSGNCDLFCSVIRGFMFFTDERDWLVYMNGTFKPYSKALAYKIGYIFMAFMFKQATAELTAAQKEAQALDDSASDEQKTAAENKVKATQAFYDFAKKNREQREISCLMTLTQDQVAAEQKEFDSKPYLLNTPSGAVDLRTGELLARSHKFKFTKCTAYSPAASQEGGEIWTQFLDEFTGGDQELQHYFQVLAGSWLFGKVYDEQAVFFSGEGANGKSSALNTILEVLGDYGIKLSPMILTTSYKTNPEPQMVKLAGARFCLMSEFRKGLTLDDGIFKQLASTDTIIAAQKFHAPEQFTPSHSLAVMSNHLPSLSSCDNGTKRRILIFPCDHTFSGDIKNYSAWMLERGVGEYVMRWLIDGAVEYYQNGCDVKPARAVREATAEYLQLNDWVPDFIADCLEVKPDTYLPAIDVYEYYLAWTFAQHEEPKSRKQFEASMKEAGHKKDRRQYRKDGEVLSEQIYRGLRQSWNGATLYTDYLNNTKH